ncbi:glycoside hydrolase family 76 protein [Aspergillus clavatus NRRL 1]|uniref:Mannan endo-1,6-alpha-mannosidase n=1 Tax=Aspergillus clavatus (strain ATCC 1007 / CBS 513.65 / DSM 816 / NCTC 3887 / NRRL 1 / QM 1276 / 107) TaxID=344612 RepID=A1CSC2_ASPCL|nr:glycosyl hydrolase, putative [Aspergillus clavatus NRRL 1]EAW08543.1 glycosyl hydrolase, putative [Aspergillus clavatus NRRL 1]
MNLLGRSSSIFLLTAFLAGQGTVTSLNLDINDVQSIKNAAATTAFNMMSDYHGNETGQIPGKLPDTWWEGGAMFMTLIQYWYWTGDPSYNDVVTQGMLWQKGNDDYFPSNYSNYLGNDDQVFWGLAAMTAAELNYPEQNGQPSWVSLAQGVFNTQVPRWDTSTCHGGLRWQIWPYQDGYRTKNAISNGGLFQLSARLARYTNNATYADWAERIWDWSATTPLLKESDWTIADTTSPDKQCTDHGDLQWTYNYGTYISGAAYMFNYTNGGSKWKKGLDGLLGTTFSLFFPFQNGTVMSEVACEPNMMCDRNQDCFKGFLSSWLTFTTTIAPYTADEIVPRIQQSALAAAKQCSGGDSHTQCGRRWHQDTWDGTTSLEEDMSALSVFSSTMITHKQMQQAQGPLTSDTGGTSKSNSSAGTGTEHSAPQALPVTTGDRAGAGVLTVVFLGAWIGAVTWMVYGR